MSRPRHRKAPIGSTGPEIIIPPASNWRRWRSMHLLNVAAAVVVFASVACLLVALGILIGMNAT